MKTITQELTTMPTTATRPSHLLGSMRHAHLLGLTRPKPAAPAKAASAKPASPKPKPAVAAKPAPRFAHLNKAAVPVAVTRAAERPSPQSIAAGWDAAAAKAGAKPSPAQQAKASRQPSQPSTTAASWDRAAEKAGLNRHRAG